jgi:hypothetical protein
LGEGMQAPMSRLREEMQAAGTIGLPVGVLN